MGRPLKVCWTDTAETTITFTKTTDKAGTPQSLNMIVALTISNIEAPLHLSSLILLPHIRLTSTTDLTMSSSNPEEATKGLNLDNIIMTAWQATAT